MAAKKKCSSCGKSIPGTARVCVFCSARQPADDAPAAEAEASPAESAAAAGAQASAASAPANLDKQANEAARRATAVTPTAVDRVGQLAPPNGAGAPAAEQPRPPANTAEREAAKAAPSQTNNTLFGIRVDDVMAAAAAHAAAEAAPAAETTAPRVAKTALAETEADDEGDEEEASAAAIAHAWITRAVMVLAGAVLLAQYASSYRVMVSFVGTPLFLQQYSLVAGLLLLATGLIRLPPRVRAALGALVGGVPLFLVGPSVGGLGGWRGVGAGLAFLVLPGALLLRARATDSRLARGLVALAVALVALLYLAPADGVMPVSAAWSLVTSNNLGGALTGIIFLAPLALAAAALSAFAGRDSTALGTLWACLALAVAPGAIIVAGVVADEGEWVHVGVALLAAGATAAVGVAQLLAPRSEPA